MWTKLVYVIGGIIILDVAPTSPQTAIELLILLLIFKLVSDKYREPHNKSGSTPSKVVPFKPSASKVIPFKPSKAIVPSVATAKPSVPIIASISSINARANTHRPIRTKVVGVTFDKGQEYLEECESGQCITILNKPIEEHPRAMAVYACFDNFKLKKLGYLKHELAQEVFERHWRGDDDKIDGVILEVTGGTRYKPNFGCNIEFYVPLVRQLTQSEIEDNGVRQRFV
jgi:hypothetical protein